MSELPAGVAPASVPVPRESACIVFVRRGQDGWTVLLGRRSRTTRFMPGHLAFPGGAVDADDRKSDGDPFARCAVRETHEETGLQVDPDSLVDLGRRITPPLFPRRFDNRFFLAEAPASCERPEPATAEFETLEFQRASDVLEDWRAARCAVPPPVLPLLRALDEGARDPLEKLGERLREANTREEAAPRIEFVPGVWMLPVATATLPPATHTNVWMPGGRRFVIVDPGSADAGEMARLLQVVERRRGCGHEPAAILLTHRHGDHIAGAVALARALDLPLRASPGVLQAAIGSEPGLRPVALEDGEELDLDGMTLRVVATPGHDMEHLAFELAEPGVAIVGDLISGISTILIDPDWGDMGAYLKSLRRMQKSGARLLLPGHGPPLPGKALARLLRHRLQREERVLHGVDANGSSLASIAASAYADAADLPQRLVQRQALAHLLHLSRRGLVRREDERWWPQPVEDVPALIETIVRERFAPQHLELRDDSAQHAGHAGASSGGGHYHLTLVSDAFEGQGRLERHRMVNDALGELFGDRIHALGLKTLTPAEWERSSD